jgi:hypothetical protein
LCLPLAILLGYLLAEPLDSISLVVFIMVLAVLAVPVLMRWHHPLLILSWNAAICPYFLPGQPPLWILMAFLSLLFAVLNRAVNPAHRFLSAPTLTRPLLALLLVVGGTAMMTGGFGMRVFGADAYGGKGYIYLLGAVLGYFALVSQPIPAAKAEWSVAVFFLSGLTAIISHLAYVAGPKFYFLYEFFPVATAMDQVAADYSLDTVMLRLGGLPVAALAVFAFMLARYGIAGIFNLARPWRLLLFFVTVGASMFGGYRSAIVLMGLTFAILFCLERVWRTRAMAMLVFLALVTGVLLVGFVDRLPLAVQRAVSFLPLNVNPLVKESAASSTEWRVEMWRSVLPQVPQYLFKGKGYALAPDDIFMATESTGRGLARSWENAAVAGDYHNGPLSVLIPFGLPGLLAFGWLLVAGTRLLHRNHRESLSELRRINAFLLAFFLARIGCFFFVFGAFYSELFYFTGILGLSVALNARPQPAAEPEPGANLNEIGWSR